MNRASALFPSINRYIKAMTLTLTSENLCSH
ncbi:hypothetical protein NCTGTJJY_CDS0189 [Serratia phage 92A1]|nr:hypothetical protein NCTGTJJY_CDS0189 [Serratia phage 92A1]